MSIFTRTFAAAALERAVKTIAQTAAALLTADAVGILGTDWGQVASIAGLAGIVSLLTSIGTGAATDGSPSLGGSERLDESVQPGELGAIDSSMVATLAAVVIILCGLVWLFQAL